MAASIRKLARHSLIYGLGHTLTRALSFLLLPLYTNYLPQEQFGLASLLFGYLSIMTIVYGFGIDAALLRYYVPSASSAEKREIFSTAFWIVLALAAGFSAVNFFLAAPLARVLTTQAGNAYLIELCAGILFLEALAVLFFLLLRAEERSLNFAVYKLANVVATLALNYIFIVRLERGASGVFEAQLCTSIFTFAAMFAQGWRQLRFLVNTQILQKFLRFGLPYLPSTAAVAAIDTCDRYILKAFTNLETVGIYSAGYRLGMIMSLVVAAFRLAWLSFYAGAAQQPNAPALFARILTYFHLACAVVYLGVSFFVDDLVRLPVGSVSLFAEEYWRSTAIVPIVLLGYWLFGIYLNLLVGLQLKEKTKYLPFITGAGLALNLAGNFLMIPSLGMKGAAWATVLAYAAMTALGYYFSQKHYPLAYEYARLLKITASVALLFGAVHFGQPAWPGRILLLVAFPFLLKLSGFFEPGEKQRFLNWIKSKLASYGGN